MIHSIPIVKTSNLTNEEIESLHVQIKAFTYSQFNDFYQKFNSEFVKNYMLTNLYERNFSHSARIEFFDNIIMLVQAEYDYGTLYCHIFSFTEHNAIEFLIGNFTGTLGADTITLVIIPKYAKQIIKYRAKATYAHHLFLHHISKDEYCRESYYCSCNRNSYFNETECDLKDWKNIFGLIEKCHSVSHIGMIKVYCED